MAIRELYEKLLQEEANPSLRDDAVYLAERKRRLAAAAKELSPADRLYLARYDGRPRVRSFIETLIDAPLYFHGDRAYGDDAAIVGGIGRFADRPVTFIGIDKGCTLDERLRTNFGMVHPEGYRKAVRLMTQAEKFGRPILTFIDTPGAYPGVGAEERGQAEAIARAMFVMSGVTVPTLAVVTGEGSSGGAMALAIADRLLMLENAVFSILSPEGFASILWKDGSQVEKAVPLMRLTARDVAAFGFCDEVIAEDLALHAADFQPNMQRLHTAMIRQLTDLTHLSAAERLAARRKKVQGYQWD